MAEQGFFVGAGKGTIAFPEQMLPTPEGYNKIHDAPHARVVLMRAGEELFAFAHLELNNVFESGTALVLETIREQAGVEADHVFFHCLHVLETPHPEPSFKQDPQALRFNELFFGAVRAAVAEACRQALASLRPARAGAAYTPCATVNTNRNIPTESGWWLGSNEAIPVDKEVATLRFETTEGEPIAILFNYNAQSSIMDHSLGVNGDRYITADLAGASAAFVESQFPGCVAMYCTGAGGDGCPSFQSKRTVLGANGKTWDVDLHETGFVLVELLGERLGSAVVQCAEQIPCRSVETVAARWGRVDFEGRPRTPLEAVIPSRSFDFSSDGSVKTMEPALLKIGEDIALVGVFAEITSETEKQIKERSAFPFTAVLTFSQIGNHGGVGMGKYMGTRDMYEKITYQAMNSGVTAGSAEKLAEYLAGFLAEQKGDGSL